MNKMKMAFYAVFSLVALGILLPDVGAAAPCTDGANCYCDKVKTPTNTIFDPNLLLCEDFEAPTLYNNVGRGNTISPYGPWNDATNRGFGGLPGENSYWRNTYGNGNVGTLYPGGFNGSAQPGDPWGANSFADMEIFRSGDFKWEVPTLTEPANASGGGSGGFDGAYSLGFRILAGQYSSVLGEVAWTPTNHLGITYAVAFPTNLHTSRITQSAWKFNEFLSADGWAKDGLAGFGEAGPTTQFPFYGFMLVSGSCPSAVASIVQTVGTMNCSFDNTYVLFHGATSFLQSRDWPLGTWGCIRAEVDFRTKTNGRIRHWFQGQGDTSETLVLDISGINFNHVYQGQGIGGMWWNGYANANQGIGEPPTLQTTYRYEDNMHVRNGAPVTCAQIGFTGGSGGGDITPPAAPVNLRIN